MVKDLFSKQLIGYAMSERINSQLVHDAITMAVRREAPAKGLIFHSDRGSQYASNQVRRLLTTLRIRRSMSRKGDPYDNAVAENFFSCLKCELVHLRQFATRQEARREIFMYIEAFYNTVRPHSALGYLSPLEFRKMVSENIVA